MTTSVCRHCQAAVTVAAGTPADAACCAHCREERDAAGRVTPRWFAVHQHQRFGPYTWQRLVSLARAGELHPDTMLFKDRSKRWIRAGTLRSLFAEPPASPAPGAPAPDEAARPQTAAVSAPPAAPRTGTVAAELEALVAYIDALDATLKPVTALPELPPVTPPAVELAQGRDAAAPLPAWTLKAEPPMVEARPESSSVLPAAVEPPPTVRPYTPAEILAWPPILGAVLVPPPAEAVVAAAPPTTPALEAVVTVAGPSPLHALLHAIGAVPWLMEGIAAATVSLLMAASLIGFLLLIQGRQPVAVAAPIQAGSSQPTPARQTEGAGTPQEPFTHSVAAPLLPATD